MGCNGGSAAPATFFNYWSDRAGELQAVREVNEGRFGDNLSLAEYPLWIETGEIRHYRKLYRLLNKLQEDPASAVVPEAVQSGAVLI